MTTKRFASSGYAACCNGASASRQFANTQTFLGYAQAKTTLKPTLRANSLTSTEVEELHLQLQQSMASVQIALSATRTAVESEAQMSVTVSPVTQSWVVKDTAF
jgi:hypothetical protein